MTTSKLCFLYLVKVNIFVDSINKNISESYRKIFLKLIEDYDQKPWTIYKQFNLNHTNQEQRKMKKNTKKSRCDLTGMQC